jgi:DNA-binding response OmpR family regulator
MSNIEPKGNILVVEDEKTTAEYVSLVLIRAGYGVRLVTSRDDALKLLSTYLYQCILLDFNMLGMSAEQFLKEAETQIPLSKIVLMSATVDAEEAAARLGLKNWIVKPFKPAEILASIASAK